MSRYLHEPKELVWNLRYYYKQLELLGAEPPDVLLVRDHAFNASCVPVARRLGLPLVLEVNAPAVESRLYFDQYLHLPLIPERLERWKLRRADFVTVVSTALRDFLVERHRLPASKFAVVPNGADTKLFHEGTRPDTHILELLEATGSTGPVIGTVGSFQKFHGTDLLARAIARLGEERPDARLLIVGDGDDLQAVKAASRPLAPRVIFSGRVPHDRVPACVACLDIGVMPDALFYGSPLKLFEWMAAGKAIVAPAYGPLKEVIDDGTHGLLFPPGDEDALLASLLRLVDQPDLRSRLGRAAAARVRESFSWRDNARRVIDTCERALRA